MRYVMIPATLAYLILCFSACAGSSPNCLKADQDLRLMKTWSGAYSVFSRYKKCDDGSVGEGYSSAIVSLLVDHWETVNELNALAKKHPTFEKFVLNHVDILMSPTQAQSIRTNAQKRCPAGIEALCKRIEYRMEHFAD